MGAHGRRGQMRNDSPLKNYDSFGGVTKNGAATKNDFAGNPTPKEYHADPDNYGNTHSVGRALIAVFAASLAAILLFGGGALGTTTTDVPGAKIVSTIVALNEIAYNISVPAGEEALSVRVVGGSSKQEKKLVPGTNEGKFAGLSAGKKYTLEVFMKQGFGETIVASKTLRTKPLDQ